MNRYLASYGAMSLHLMLLETQQTGCFWAWPAIWVLDLVYQLTERLLMLPSFQTAALKEAVM